ncbi:hypothetical protein HCN51_42475 [Nonomuraea sp. FMUSA5-5]|uniref:Uncharacterized protein n=1 Tax=Nonomuraea composti TaxID=2720023 RepID=A0ABX1BE28_9ACTN|nr:hypothetical protein [Nonomuraea sp. FMUSA5-5]NJP96030.1 hypothetical protein [Nonomuraea sp. FMUSA5-5]
MAMPPDHGRGQQRKPAEQLTQRPDAFVHLYGEGAAWGCVRHAAGRRSVPGGELGRAQSADEQRHAEDGQQRRGEEHLHAVLPPGKPQHFHVS